VSLFSHTTYTLDYRFLCF